MTLSADIKINWFSPSDHLPLIIDRTDIFVLQDFFEEIL